MAKLIRVDSSLSPQSFSRSLADEFQKKWEAKQDDCKVIQYDFLSQPLPHIDPFFIESISVPNDQRSEAQIARLQRSNQLIDDLRSADHLLISVPMYNFGVPSHLKAYFDHVGRAGETFRYTENGPEGLLKHLKATVVVASGGDYTQSPLNQMDHVTPFIRTFLSFIGIDEVEFIQVPNMASQGEAQQASLEQAEKEIQQLFKDGKAA